MAPGPNEMAPGPNEIRPQAQMRLGPGHKPDWDPGTSQIGTWAQTRLGPGLLSSLVPDCVIWFLTQIQFNLSWEWFLGPNIQFRMQCFRPQMIFKAYLIRCQSSNDLQIDLVHWFIFYNSEVQACPLVMVGCIQSASNPHALDQL